jgi:dipeptidase D
MTKDELPSSLDALEPRLVWEFFSRMAAVPRPSKKEQQIRVAMRAMAEEHGLTVREDAVGNLLIEAPASKGCESAPVTVLQGHVDMVCVQNPDSNIDFETEGITPVIDRDAKSGEPIVRAKGTTLGADNGIGVALALAAAVSPDVTRGPLEILLTTDEETGMTGAGALTPKSFRGRRLLNLDSEEDDILYIGCAGGRDITLTFDSETRKPAGEATCCRVSVTGLRGGHSGGDIHENRGNAIKILARTLLGTDSKMQLVSIDGGELRNVIPSDASAVVSGSPQVLDALRAAAEAVTRAGRAEFAEPDLTITVALAPDSDGSPALSAEATTRLLTAITALPHGVMGVDRAIKGLVETSNNIATIKSSQENGKGLRVVIGALARSSSEVCKHTAVAQIESVGRLAGANVESGNDYPGWQPNPDSPTLAVCKRVYKERFGEDAEVTAIHAGLECGIIGDNVGDVDMISFGPRIEGAHTPDERVYIASVQKSWRFLTAVLAELAHTT